MLIQYYKAIRSFRMLKFDYRGFEILFNPAFEDEALLTVCQHRKRAADFSAALLDGD